MPEIARVQQVVDRLAQLERLHASGKVWDMLLKGLIPVVIASGSVIISNSIKANTLDARLAAIEQSRFTDRDASELERRLRETPTWLRIDLTDIKALLREMDGRLRSVEQKVK